MKFHPAGKGIIRNTILIVIVLNLIGWIFLSTWMLSLSVTYASLILLIMILQFFRYPRRQVTTNAKLIMAPADGTICMIEEAMENEYLKSKCLKVSIFMSPLNVHINWVPVPGTVTFLKHKKGEFHAAFKDKSAEENERFVTAIKLPDGREIVVKQIAGAMARRILNYLETGKQVSQAIELGFIRFGSRVDLYLPSDTKLKVHMDQRVRGSQTIIGELQTMSNE